MTTARAVRGRAPAAPDCSSTEVTSGSWRMAGNLIYHTAMHSSRELRSSSFEVRVDGRPARLKEVVVGAEPQAILEAIDDRAISRLVVEDGEPADRTGLVVEGGEPADGGLDDEVVVSARGRIRTCLAYSPAGRAHDADVEIAGNRVTEGYVEAILDPESRIERLRAELAEAESRIERLRAELAEAEADAPPESAPRSGAASATAPPESAPRSDAASADAPPESAP